MNLAWIYGFNVLINSALAFLTVALLVKFLLWACRIQQPRVQALALSVPLFKVGFDLFLYNFSGWALAHGINPMLCEAGTRAISVSVAYPASTFHYFPFNTNIHFSVADGKTFTAADLIALSIDPLWMKLIVALALIISAMFCSLRLMRSLQGRKIVKKIVENSLPCLRMMAPPIETALKKRKVQVFISADVDVPCAVNRFIILPMKLIHQLSQNEFEAIVVHELDHLRWKDSILRAAQRMLSAFFWWIPMKRWRSRLELAQELACDARISKFGLSPVNLASAIMKAARFAKASNPCLPVMCFVEKGRLLARMKALMGLPKKRSLGFAIGKNLLIFTLLTVIFFGQFWIF